VADELYLIHGRRSPFKDYVRMLTPEGGILILYKDQDRSLFLKILRIFAWVMATGVGLAQRRIRPDAMIIDDRHVFMSRTSVKTGPNCK
jgi:hypothetical protein